MPGYFFWKTDVVSGIIWPVISGLDTTATVTVPELLLPLLLVPPLEQAATTSTAATQPAAPSVRSLNREDLMNEPPRRCECLRPAYAHLSTPRSDEHEHTVIWCLGKVKESCKYEIWVLK